MFLLPKPIPISLIFIVSSLLTLSKKVAINAITVGVVISPLYFSSTTVNAISFFFAISKTVGTGTGRRPWEVDTTPFPAGGLEK